MDELVEKIMRVANLRREIDARFTVEDARNGNYFDVIEKIGVPSVNGEYKDFDAVIVVTKQQSDFLKSIIREGKIKIAYICI